MTSPDRNRRARLAASACVTVLASLVGAASVARADEQGDLDKARAAYLARRYDEAERRFRTMLDPANGTIHDPALLSRARMYWGAVALAKSSLVQATAIFEKLLLDDPTFEPDPLSFPADVINAFIDTRARMRERLSAMAAEQARKDAERRAREEAERKRQAEHLALVEHLASEETTTVHHSRWVALLPFGVGQFQNGDTALGWVFLGTEAALAIAGAAVIPIYTTQSARGYEEHAAGSDGVALQYFHRATVAQDLNIVFLGVAAGVAGVGIIDAEARFVPDQVVVKHRPLPDARARTPWILPSLAPTFAPNGRMGGQASVSIAF